MYQRRLLLHLMTRALGSLALGSMLLACQSSPDVVGSQGERLVPELVLDGPELYEPTSVALGEDGRIHVLDAGSYRLYTYGPSGELLTERGRKGEGPGEFPFLQTGRSEVVVAGDHAVVMMPGAHRLVVWNLSTEATLEFRTANSPTSVALHGSKVFVTMAAAAAPEPRASIHEFRTDGTPVAHFGERFQPQWDDPAVHRLVRMQNRSMLAISPQGTLFEAGSWWPWVRAYADRSRQWERWIDFAWFRNPARRAFFGRSQSKLASFSYSGIGEDPLSSSPRLFDLAASRTALFALLGNSGNVQVFTHDGEAVKTFWLLPEGVDEDVVAVPMPTPKASTIGVDPDGSRLCTASYHTGKVLCFNVDLGAAGAG